MTKEEKREYMKRWYAANPDYRRQYYQAHKDDWRAGERRRSGVKDATGETRIGTCPICLKPDKRLLCDHDYETGEIRGWPCSRCNTFIGRTAADAIGRAERILAYIKGPTH